MVTSSQATSPSDDTADIQFGISPILRKAKPRLNDEKWAGYNALILLVSLIAIGMLVIGCLLYTSDAADE